MTESAGVTDSPLSDPRYLEDFARFRRTGRATGLRADSETLAFLRELRRTAFAVWPTLRATLRRRGRGFGEFEVTLLTFAATEPRVEPMDRATSIRKSPPSEAVLCPFAVMVFSVKEFDL